MSYLTSRQVDWAFSRFSDDIIPPDYYIQGGKKAVTKIFELLRTRSVFNLDRMYIGGSEGKKTSILRSDFDCVIFINDQFPLFTSVLENFKNILSTVPQIRKLRMTRFTLHFNYKGYEIDLVPATNHVNHQAQQPKFRTLAAKQALKTFKAIEKDENPAHYHSSSISETQLRFMRRQGSFIHELVRVCKFWNKTLMNIGYLKGRSTMIELVAVNAGQIEEDGPDENLSLFRAFKTFLETMADFGNTHISFDFDPLQPIRWRCEWEPSPPDELTDTTPCVIEPANPYNNIARGMRPGQIKIFEEAATETLNRLEQFQNYDQLFQFWIYLFSPQPMLLNFGLPWRAEMFQQSEFIVEIFSYGKHGYNGGNIPFIIPSIVVRNEDHFGSGKIMGILKQMEQMFVVVTETFVSAYTMDDDDDDQDDDEVNEDYLQEISCNLRTRLEACIDDHVLNCERRDWHADEDDDMEDDDEEENYDHEQDHVTFEIPVDVPNLGQLWIRISMSAIDDDDDDEEMEEDETSEDDDDDDNY